MKSKGIEIRQQSGFVCKVDNNPFQDYCKNISLIIKNIVHPYFIIRIEFTQHNSKKYLILVIEETLFLIEMVNQIKKSDKY